MNLPCLKTAAVATAFVLPLGLAANASAQALDEMTDSDTVPVTAEVVASMDVTAENSVDLGPLPQGAAFEVAADPSVDDFDSAQFTINGAADLEWQLSVVWNDLVGPGPEVITLDAPSDDDVCFSNTVDAQVCDQNLNSGGTVSGHGGDGTAWVGYSVSVPADATVGEYNGSIELTAEALIGG